MPGQVASAIRTQQIELGSIFHNRFACRMITANDGETIINMTTLAKQINELAPYFLPFASSSESFSVPDHDQGIPCSGEEDIQTLRRVHESDVVVGITSTE